MKRFLWMLMIFVGLAYSSVAWAQFEVKFADDPSIHSYNCGGLAQVIGEATEQQLSPVIITLTEDVEGSVEFLSSIRAHIIIDLDGHTWSSSSGGSVIENSGGVMTICDNGPFGGGTVWYTGTDSYACAVKNDGFLQITGGTFRCDSGKEPDPEAKRDSITSVMQIDQTNVLLIRGGTFNELVRCEDYTTCEVAGGYFPEHIMQEGESGTLWIRGGVYGNGVPRVAPGYAAELDLTTKTWTVVPDGEDPGGWLKGLTGWFTNRPAENNAWETHYYVFAPDNLTLQLNTQEQTNPYALLFVDMDRVTVGSNTSSVQTQLDLNGQTVKVLDCEGYNGSSQLSICAPGTIGSIVNLASGLTVKKVGSGDITLPENYTWESDGTLGKVIAKVNGKYYTTFEAAQKAANANGAEIVLLNTPEHRVQIEQDTTVDLNTYALFPVVKKGATLTLTGIGTLSNALIATENAQIKKPYKILDSMITLPDGYEWRDNKLAVIAPIRLSSESYGEMLCGSLALAHEATNAAEWTTYTLTCSFDIAEKVTIATEKNIILDLNGFGIDVIAGNGQYCFDNYGRLIIRDSTGNGYLQGDNTHVVVNRGLLGVEGGRLISPKSTIWSTEEGRVWVEGGELRSTAKDYAISVQGSGGGEITGGSFYGSCRAYDAGHLRIRGGSFSVDPSKYVKGSYQATYDANTSLWVVTDTTVEAASAATVQSKMQTLSLSNTTEALSVGTLSLDDTGATILTLDSPYKVVEGATIMLNGETVATVPSPEVATVSTFSLASSDDLTEKEKAIEANKQLDVLGASYEVSVVNGELILSYAYDFNVDAMTVTPMDDGSHEVSFVVGLREGEDNVPRSDQLKKAKLVIYRNGKPLDGGIVQPIFENGTHTYTLINVADDAEESSAQLFRVHLEPLN